MKTEAELLEDAIDKFFYDATMQFVVTLDNINWQPCYPHLNTAEDKDE